MNPFADSEKRESPRPASIAQAATGLNPSANATHSPASAIGRTRRGQEAFRTLREDATRKTLGRPARVTHSSVSAIGGNRREDEVFRRLVKAANARPWVDPPPCDTLSPHRLSAETEEKVRSFAGPRESGAGKGGRAAAPHLTHFPYRLSAGLRERMSRIRNYESCAFRPANLTRARVQESRQENRRAKP